MTVLRSAMTVLGIGIVLVAIAAALLVWQLPSLRGTISVGDSGVTLHGFDDPDGDNAGLAMALVGVAVVGGMLAAVVAAIIAVVVGLGAAVLGLALALVAVAGSLVLVASPLLLVGWLVWLVLRQPPARPAGTAATVAP